MNLTEQVITQASFLAPEVVGDNMDLLRTVCTAVVSSLEARLRDDLEPGDCLSDFVTAAGMYAVAALAEIGDWNTVEQLTAGDLTVRRGGNDRAAQYLRSQADLLMAPHLKTGFAFMGV